LRVDYAELSLIGGRDENQDRCAAAISDEAAMLLVVDGMGGHSDGARAAEVAIKLLQEAFWHTRQPFVDPIGFLHLNFGAAHEAVVELGARLPLEHRPRATVAACIVQSDVAYWAHIGDSRVYHFRGGKLLERTRDHSHVEFLIREGVISADQAQAHPMRNYVECCLGGELMLPEMSLAATRRLQPGDMLLVCSDGVWGCIDEDLLAAALTPVTGSVRDNLAATLEQAVAANGPGSDNSTAVVLRWLGPS
jgi:serine/threonine protein phosphatase PrpC